MNIYTHYALWRDRVAAAGLVDRFSVCVTIGCGFLPEGAEVVERAVHVVEARRRLARQRVERPVHRRERGRGDFRWIETSPNATRRRFVAMSASSMCSERWAGRGADGVTRRGLGFLAQLLMSRATLSRGIDDRPARVRSFGSS